MKKIRDHLMTTGTCLVVVLSVFLADAQAPLPVPVDAEADPFIAAAPALPQRQPRLQAQRQPLPRL